MAYSSGLDALLERRRNRDLSTSSYLDEHPTVQTSTSFCASPSSASSATDMLFGRSTLEGSSVNNITDDECQTSGPVVSVWVGDVPGINRELSWIFYRAEYRAFVKCLEKIEQGVSTSILSAVAVVGHPGSGTSSSISSTLSSVSDSETFRKVDFIVSHPSG